MPAASVEIENVALPEIRDPLPIVAVPSLNVTVPVAVEGDTVAVKVTVWPEVDGFKLEARLLLVPILLAAFIDCAIAEDELPL